MTEHEADAFETDDFFFKHLQKVRISPHNAVQPGATQGKWLAISSQYQTGVCVEAGIFLIGFCTAEVHLLKTTKQNLNTEYDFLRLKRVRLHKDGKINSISINSDGRLLAASVNTPSGPFIYIYDIGIFLSDYSGHTTPTHEIRLSANSAAESRALEWNPEINNVYAASANDGTIVVGKIDPANPNSVSFIGEKKFGASVDVISWSPKGKQLTVGDSVGKVVQLKPELDIVRSTMSQSSIQNSGVIGLIWLSTTEWLVAYGKKEDASIDVCILTIKKDNKPSISRISELSYGLKQGVRNPAVTGVLLPEWNFVSVISARGTEVSVIAKAQDQWQLWQLDEDLGRFDLPISSDKAVTFPLGIAIDVSNQNEIVLNEQGTSKVPASPIVFVLTSDGVLCSAHAVSKFQQHVSIQKKPGILEASTVKSGPPAATELSTAPVFEPATNMSPFAAAFAKFGKATAPAVATAPVPAQPPVSVAPSQAPPHLPVGTTAPLFGTPTTATPFGTVTTAPAPAAVPAPGGPTFVPADAAPASVPFSFAPVAPPASKPSGSPLFVSSEGTPAPATTNLFNSAPSKSVAPSSQLAAQTVPAANQPKPAAIVAPGNAAATSTPTRTVTSAAPAPAPSTLFQPQTQAFPLQTATTTPQSTLSIRASPAPASQPQSSLLAGTMFAPKAPLTTAPSLAASPATPAPEQNAELVKKRSDLKQKLQSLRAEYEVVEANCKRISEALEQTDEASQKKSQLCYIQDALDELTKLNDDLENDQGMICYLMAQAAQRLKENVAIVTNSSEMREMLTQLNARDAFDREERMKRIEEKLASCQTLRANTKAALEKLAAAERPEYPYSRINPQLGARMNDILSKMAVFTQTLRHKLDRREAQIRTLERKQKAVHAKPANQALEEVHVSDALHIKPLVPRDLMQSRSKLLMMLKTRCQQSPRDIIYTTPTITKAPGPEKSSQTNRDVGKVQSMLQDSLRITSTPKSVLKFSVGTQSPDPADIKAAQQQQTTIQSPLIQQKPVATSGAVIMNDNREVPGHKAGLMASNTRQAAAEGREQRLFNPDSVSFTPPSAGTGLFGTNVHLSTADKKETSPVKNETPPFSFTPKSEPKPLTTTATTGPFAQRLTSASSSPTTATQAVAPQPTSLFGTTTPKDNATPTSEAAKPKPSGTVAPTLAPVATSTATSTPSAPTTQPQVQPTSPFTSSAVTTTASIFAPKPAVTTTATTAPSSFFSPATTSPAVSTSIAPTTTAPSSTTFSFATPATTTATTTAPAASTASTFSFNTSNASAPFSTSTFTFANPKPAGQSIFGGNQTSTAPATQTQSSIFGGGAAAQPSQASAFGGGTAASTFSFANAAAAAAAKTPASGQSVFGSNVGQSSIFGGKQSQGSVFSNASANAFSFKQEEPKASSFGGGGIFGTPKSSSGGFAQAAAAVAASSGDEGMDDVQGGGGGSIFGGGGFMSGLGSSTAAKNPDKNPFNLGGSSSGAGAPASSSSVFSFKTAAAAAATQQQSQSQGSVFGQMSTPSSTAGTSSVFGGAPRFGAAPTFGTSPASQSSVFGGSGASSGFAAFAGNNSLFGGNAQQGAENRSSIFGGSGSSPATSSTNKNAFTNFR